MVGRVSRDKILVVIFIGYLMFVGSLFAAQQAQSAKSSSTSVVLNATVSATVAITASTAITEEGISFGSPAVNTDNNNGTGNTNGFSEGSNNVGNTTYNISIDSTTDVNVNISHRLNESLTKGSDVITAGNITTKHNSTNANESIWVNGTGEVTMSSDEFVNLTIDSTTDCAGLAANAECHIAFFLDVPSGTVTGDYVANYCFCAFQDNDGTAYAACTCS